MKFYTKQKLLIKTEITTTMLWPTYYPKVPRITRGLSAKKCLNCEEEMKNQREDRDKFINYEKCELCAAL